MIDAEELLREIRDWQKQRPVRSWRTPPKPDDVQLIEPMDKATRDELLSEAAGHAPPVLVPVLKKRKMRSRQWLT